MKSYFNMATMGDRGKTLFSVVPTILPEIFNLLWIVSTFIDSTGKKMLIIGIDGLLMGLF